MTEPRSSPYRVVLFAAFLIVAGLLVHELVTLLIVVLLTVLLAIPVAAFADRCERVGVPRAVGAAAGMLLFVGIWVGVAALIIPTAIDQGDRFIDNVPAIVDSAVDRVADIKGEDSGEVGEDLQDFLQGYVDDPSKLAGPIASIGLSVLNVIGTLLLIMITAYFMAVRPGPLVDSAVGLVPPDFQPIARNIFTRVRQAWIGWMQGVGLDMIISGVLLYIGLRIVDLDFALLFAVFTALMVVIPYFGSIISGIPPVVFALTESPEKALLVLIVYVLVQQIEGNITMPLVMANRTKLHPAAIALGVVAVSQLVGIIGLFVAVPIITLVVTSVDELWVKPNERRVAAVESALPRPQP